MSAPPSATASVSEAGLVFAPAPQVSPSGALRLGPGEGADAVSVPAALASAGPVPLAGLGAGMPPAPTPPGDDAVVATVSSNPGHATLLGLPEGQPDTAETILSWVPGAANDAGVAGDPQVDAVVHATLASLLGSENLAEAAVLEAGRDLAEPPVSAPAFVLAHGADDCLLEPAALATAVAESGSALGEVVLAVDGIELMLLSADAFASPLSPDAPDEALDLYGTDDAIDLPLGEAELSAYDDLQSPAEDVYVIEVVGEPGDPGLAFL